MALALNPTTFLDKVARDAGQAMKAEIEKAIYDALKPQFEAMQLEAARAIARSLEARRYRALRTLATMTEATQQMAFDLMGEGQVTTEAEFDRRVDKLLTIVGM